MIHVDSELAVSRETRAKLELLLSEVQRWNATINLVAKRSQDNPWVRHIVDSMQVFHAWNGVGQHWADLGSGGGFPGLVVALMAQSLAPQLRITLVDADSRKCTFLDHAARMIGVNVEVRCERLETLTPLVADIVSARALAPLHSLLGLAFPHMAPRAIGLFSKGARFPSEIETARRAWQFDCDVLPSQTAPGSAILVVRNVAHG